MDTKEVKMRARFDVNNIVDERRQIGDQWIEVWVDKSDRPFCLPDWVTVGTWETPQHQYDIYTSHLGYLVLNRVLE